MGVTGEVRTPPREITSCKPSVQRPRFPDGFLEARPETGFLAVSGTVTPLFPTHDFPERAFLDGPLDTAKCRPTARVWRSLGKISSRRYLGAASHIRRLPIAERRQRTVSYNRDGKRVARVRMPEER
jgi:hypothetical protein